MRLRNYESDWSAGNQGLWRARRPRNKAKVTDSLQVSNDKAIHIKMPLLFTNTKSTCLVSSAETTAVIFCILGGWLAITLEFDEAICHWQAHWNLQTQQSLRSLRLTIFTDAHNVIADQSDLEGLVSLVDLMPSVR